MAFDTNIPSHAPPVREIPHYHGDALRAIFVAEAAVLVVGAAMAVALPLSTAAAVLAAIVLVVAAGVTNPAQEWIHYVNGVLAVLGTFVFGVRAIDTYRGGVDTSFVFVLALALMSLAALYLATRTIRGMILRERY